MLRSIAAVLAASAACAAPPPAAPPQETAPPVRSDAAAPPAEPVAAKRSPAPVEPAPVETTPAPRKTLLSISAEWDATAGPDAIALFPDGRLVAGTEEGRASLPTSGGYFFGEQAALAVVQLGDPQHARALVVAIPTGDEEDPPNVYQVFVSDRGKLRKIYEATIGSYGVVPLEFAGDGTATYLEDGWTACERAKFPTEVARATVVLRIGKDGMLGEVKRRKTKQTQKCGELAACPFVYVIDDGLPVLQGEILRNLRGRAREAEQALALAVPPTSVLRVRVAEEKDEVTRLDAIALVVDGVEVLPRACLGAQAPAFCTTDGAHELLRRGDAIELTFDVPREAAAIELRARGYYGVPRPRR